MMTLAIISGLLISILIAYFTSKPTLERVEKPIEPNLYNVPSRLKFEKTWFSGDYVTPYFFYYNRWVSIRTIGKPVLSLEDNWIKDLTYSLGSGDFNYEKKRWATVGACIEHNRNVYKELEENNISLKRQRKDLHKKKEEAFKRANS